MPKVILDTNVLVSGLVFGGKMGQILESLLCSEFELIVSRHLLEEVYRILIQKFGLSIQGLGKLQEILEIVSTFEPSPEFDYSKEEIRILDTLRQRDPKDVYLLELFFQSQASLLVSGDKDLLELPSQEVETLAIIKPSSFLEFLNR